MKNRTVIGIICVAFAFLLFFAAVPLLSESENSEYRYVRAKSKIARGTCVSAEDIEVYYSSEKKEGALNASELIVGKYAVCDIFPGDGFTADKLSEKSDSAAEALCRLEEGELAVTVPVGSLSAGFSGQLENGDIVRVFFRSSKGTENPDALQYVRVITTVTAEGVSRDGARAGSSEAQSLPATVMLAVNNEQAALLFAHSSDASLYLAFVCHCDDEMAGTYLERQKKVFSADLSRTSSLAAENAGGKDETDGSSDGNLGITGER